MKIRHFIASLMILSLFVTGCSIQSGHSSKESTRLSGNSLDDLENQAKIIVQSLNEEQQTAYLQTFRLAFSESMRQSGGSEQKLEQLVIKQLRGKNPEEVIALGEALQIKQATSEANLANFPLAARTSKHSAESFLNSVITIANSLPPADAEKLELAFSRLQQNVIMQLRHEGTPENELEDASLTKLYKRLGGKSAGEIVALAELLP